MIKFVIIFFSVMILLIPIITFSDIIVTKDDMILNGKIIEEVKDEYAVIANYHGTFKITFNNIKEIHRTDDYKEDVEILIKLGQMVDETEVEKNFQTGREKTRGRETEKNDLPPGLKIDEPDLLEPEFESIKIEPDLKDSDPESKDAELDIKAVKPGKKDIKPEIKKTSQPKVEFILLLSPFINFNFEPFGRVMPFGYGVIILSNVIFQKKFIYLPAGVSVDLQYFHSGEAVKNIDGFRFSAGPIWVFPFKYFNLTFSAVFGGGYYGIRGNFEKKETMKFNFTFTAGPEFIISSWVISPKLRFDFIYDGIVPLYGIGISVEAGYRFQFF
jgi:hypothetical protein